MSAAPRQDSPSLEVCEKAMMWWLDLHSPGFDAAMHNDLNAWRQANPLHECAWQRAQALGSQMQALRSQGDPRLARTALLLPNDAGPTRRRAIKGLALLLAAGASAWSARDSELVQQLSADYATGVNEQRQITLASDLAVHLNTRTRLNATQVNSGWQLALLGGELLVDSRVAPALTLATAQVLAQAATARFVVRQFDQQPTQLLVYAGSVQVASRNAPGITVLHAGQQARFDAFRLLGQSALEQNSPAWVQGMIVAHGQPLPAFLAELGRYRHGHLGCDPALDGLKVWGTYPLADSERIIDAVAQTLQLDVQRFTRLWVNLRARSAPA